MPVRVTALGIGVGVGVGGSVAVGVKVAFRVGSGIGVLVAESVGVGVGAIAVRLAATRVKTFLAGRAEKILYSGVCFRDVVVSVVLNGRDLVQSN